MKQELLNQIIEILLTLAVLITTGVIIPEIRKWVQSKTDSNLITTSMDELLREVDIAVNYTEQTLVKQLKEDGKWDSDHQKEALELAINTVLANLSQKTSTYLQENSNNIVDTISHYVESNILYKKDR
jgi:hypothetical protein